MEKAVLVFSGGADSVCAAVHLSSRYDIYGITFSYGQRAGPEMDSAERFARLLNFGGHTTADMGFMKGLYSGTNVLTDPSREVPGSFDYSIVAPVRNAVFLSVAATWAYSLGAPLVAYGAHTGDQRYPDCRPPFSDMMQDALNLGEADGISSGIRRRISIWSPYSEGLSKSDLLRAGYGRLGRHIFETWSCYLDGPAQCGSCESCSNRRRSFAAAGIPDGTKYASGRDA